jgi:ribonuclease HII
MSEKSLSEIKESLQNLEDRNLGEWIDTYSADERAGVQKLVESAKKRQTKFRQELERINLLWTFERQHPEAQMICGIDEVGRGPFAGPVVAGAVILPKDCDILYINDSKKLSAKMRDQLYDEIREKAVACAVGHASPERIDEINILQATYEAMREAISNLGVTPDLLLNDAVTIPKVSIPQVPIIKGDAKSISIGAASIYAKVTRDREMLEYAKQYPQYGFDRNVGYGTAEHIEALKQYGPSPIHRRSFISNYV